MLNTFGILTGRNIPNPFAGIIIYSYPFIDMSSIVISSIVELLFASLQLLCINVDCA